MLHYYTLIHSIRRYCTKKISAFKDTKYKEVIKEKKRKGREEKRKKNERYVKIKILEFFPQVIFPFFFIIASTVFPYIIYMLNMFH